MMLCCECLVDEVLVPHEVCQASKSEEAATVPFNGSRDLAAHTQTGSAHAKVMQMRKSSSCLDDTVDGNDDRCRILKTKLLSFGVVA